MDGQLTHCTLCPRQCGIDRTKSPGPCQGGGQIRVAKAMLHHWEEPCISGTRGSGTVFFSGCTLGCCYCQNYSISHEGYGQPVSVDRLADIFRRLQDQGAHNLNLVNPTHYVPWIIRALEVAKPAVPVIYNSSGYERVETLRRLDGYISIYLPDLKFFSPVLSKRYTGRKDYFSAASRAILEMQRQTGRQIEDAGGLIQKGLIVRHLVLPGNTQDSLHLLDWLSTHLSKDAFSLSLMSQYTPFYRAASYPEINRRLTTLEYQRVLAYAQELGFSGYRQQRCSAREEYTPSFDGKGI